jgi:hypothetical protein
VTIFKRITRIPAFDKDIKKLLKRFPTLESDLETFIDKELKLYHKLRIDNKGVFPIPGFGCLSPKFRNVPV